MLFCPLPWIHQAIRNNGDLRVCCQANQGPDKGLLRKSDGTIYNAATDDLEESRNSQKMKDIRKCMLNNKWHPDCIRCKREEHSGIRSRFKYEKTLWDHLIKEDDAIKLTKEDGSININSIPITFYDLRFGNLCNLKCRMCGPTDSNSWYEDYAKTWNADCYEDTAGTINIIVKNGRYDVDTNVYEWYKNETFWNQLYNNVSNIEHIQVVGGEPFLIRQHFDLLEKCIEKKCSNNITVEYNSNLTFIPEKAWSLWNHFKQIKIGASIDGIGIVNEYIRYPSKWNDIETNLKKLDEAEGNFKLHMTVTVQALNILHLPDIIEWSLQQNFKRIGTNIYSPFIVPHPLHSPYFYNIKVFPKYIKEKIKNRLDEYKFTKDSKYIKNLIDKYCHYMFNDDLSEDMPMFWRYNNRLDELRNQKLKDYIPELYELIGETNVI